MKKPGTDTSSVAWASALHQCADAHRVRHYVKILKETSVGDEVKRASKAQACILAAVFSGSQALSSLLVARPEWIELLRPENLQYPRRKQGLEQELEKWLAPLHEPGEPTAGLAKVREFKAREMLRIGARDLVHRADVPEVIGEISDLADVCLEAVWQLCTRKIIQRYGEPYHQDAAGHWQPTTACVLGMGKLGGRELNYSSDVDVLFVYSAEGEVYKQPPSADLTQGKNRSGAGQGRSRSGSQTRQDTPFLRPSLTNHQFFNRLAEAFISEVSRLEAHGTLYRIDLRLRPEGDTGPLTRSIDSYETYYAQWGQTWERMMLIKARCVAGEEGLAAEFLETIQPFRYPRLINQSVLLEVGAMKDRIENEVVRADELERNVKLGRGGIREIEFTTQALQLLHAGRQPFLQGAQTLPSLEKLAQYELIPIQAARDLKEAYCFLRAVEHRLQMENQQQTHTIPLDKSSQHRLARLMGFANQKQFESARRAQCDRVRETFETVLKGEVPASPSKSHLPKRFEGEEARWKRLLEHNNFKDVEKAFRVLREFVEGPGYVHVSARTSELALGLLPRIFELCPGGMRPKEQGTAPDRELKSKSPNGPLVVPEEGSAANFKARALFVAHPSLFGRPNSHPPGPLSDPDRVVMRLDNFVTAYGARSTLFELWHSNPAIFELLLLLFDRSEFLAELAIRTPDLVDELVTSGRLRQRKSAEETLSDLRHGLEDDDQQLWLRRYYQAEVMRIGLRDILGLADYEQYLIELSALADACLRYALESTLRQQKLKAAPFVIIGLGKLGGAEIDYGSDLDILFAADPKARNLTKLKTVALGVLDLLSTRTEQGLVFHTDARLRPDGEKGLLVNTLTAYEAYYRRRAMLWEIQALTRTRAIAGDLRLGEKFQKMAAVITDFSQPPRELAAYTPDWKSKIHQMRMRIQNERTPRGQEDLAIKTGAGGLMDAEFIAQTVCMQHGWQEANTLKALQRGSAAGVLPEAEKLIESYRSLRRVEGILRRWSYEGETVLPQDPAAFYRVSVRCGFESPKVFGKALYGYRQAIREVYERVFQENQVKSRPPT